MMYDRDEKALVWLYALPDGALHSGEFDVVDFVGGVYAAAVAIDGDTEDEQRVYGDIKNWIATSDVYELDERPGYYDLSHVITSEEAFDAMGYRQLEVFVPIKIVRRS